LGLTKAKNADIAVAMASIFNAGQVQKSPKLPVNFILTNH